MAPSTILITGATTGIGRDAADHLARGGHRVIATGRDPLALAELREAGFQTIQLDVTKADSITRAVLEVDALTEGRGLDVLVNNAGFGIAAPIIETCDEDVRAQYDTNVFGLLAVTRAFATGMMRARRGRIINIGSVGGRMTMPFLGAYNSTKHAVESITDALRLELGPFGIQVALIEPGPVRSEFSNRSMQRINEGSLSSSAYNGALARADLIKARADRAAAPASVVSRAIEHAVVARRARTRYVVPKSSALLLCLAMSSPTRIVDAALRALFGLTRARLFSAAAARPEASA